MMFSPRRDLRTLPTDQSRRTFFMSFSPRCCFLMRCSAGAPWLALLLVVCSSPAVRAQSTDTGPAQTEELSADTFSIPEGLNTPEQSFEFIEEMAANNDPADRSEAAMMAYQRKLARTIALVVEKVLAMETTPRRWGAPLSSSRTQ